MRKIIYLILCFFLVTGLIAETKESWSKPEGQLGEELEYTIESDSGEELVLPELGFLQKEDADLPYAEILSAVKVGTQVKIRIVFLEAGEMSLPLQWKENSENVGYSKKIIIKSSLTGQEEDILDITGPIEFSGFSLFRLLGIALIFMLSVAILYYFFLKRKPATRKPNNLPVQIIEGEKNSAIWENVDNLLKEEEFSHKEFVFLLSSAIKEQITESTRTRIIHLTNKELMEFVQKTHRISNLDGLYWETYFSNLKYMPNEETIVRAKAQEKILFWKKLLRV